MGKLKSKLQDGTINIPGLILKLFLIWFIFSFLVFPNVNLLLKVFIKDGHFSLDAIHKIMKSTRAINSLKNSFLLAVASVVTVNVSGILIVLFTEYFDIKGSKILSLGFMTTVKETIGVGVNEKAALSSDKNCPFVYINFDFTLVNKVASL